MPSNPYLRSLQVNCTRLDDSSFDYLLRPSLQELSLHNCADFTGKLLSHIGQRCKDLRWVRFFFPLIFLNLMWVFVDFLPGSRNSSFLS